MASTSSTQMDIQTPLSLSSEVKVSVLVPLPRPPWPSWQRKISTLPLLTAPNPGGSPQSQSFFHPSLSNHAMLSAKFETFNIGVTPCAIIGWVRILRFGYACQLL